MPRPKTKRDLLEMAEANYRSLLAELEGLTLAQMEAPGVVGDWSVKDVLVHLTAWQQMCLGWYRAGLEGKVPRTPSEKYTWKQTPELNHEIWLAHKDDELAAVRSELEASHGECVETIKSISNEELFESRPYQWTKSTTLGAYFVSATSSHYDWARKEIRRGLRNLTEQSA